MDPPYANTGLVSVGLGPYTTSLKQLLCARAVFVIIICHVYKYWREIRPGSVLPLPPEGETSS